MNSFHMGSIAFFIVLIIALMAVFSSACSKGDDDDDSVLADDTESDDDSGTADDSAVDDDAADDTADDTSDDTVADDTADDTSDDDTAVECNAVIKRQPYLQDVTAASIKVMWKTNRPADSVVEYGLTQDLGLTASADEFDSAHLVLIEGLESGKTYYYKARSCGDESPIGHFRTSPPPGDPFSFVAFSDNQTNYDIFTRIAALMAEQGPDLAISSGDMVGSGWDPFSYDKEFFGPGQELFRNAPVYIAQGNHEGESIMFYMTFSFPKGRNVHYSFTYGNTFFIAIDTNRPVFPGSPQYEWFVNELASDAAQDAEFRVAFFHKPPWSEGWEGYDGEPDVRNYILPVMEDYGVDVYFNGHTHDYERGLLNGVASYIIGGAAGDLDPWARDFPWILVWEAVHHFVRVRVDGPVMTLDAINIDGEVFDTYQIVH